MKLNFKKVLKNDMVLYVLVFLAFANVASFLSNGDYESAILFVALSVLTSHFTKNNAIVLLVSLLVTQLMRRRVREGMKEGNTHKKTKKASNKDVDDEDDEDDEDGDDKDDEDDEGQVGMTNMKKKKGKKDGFSSGKIDQAATLKKAYSNLDDVLGKGGMEGVTKDTSALIKQQQQLMKQIEMATPVLNNAMKMMETPTFQKIADGSHMKGMDKMQEMFAQLTNGTKSKSE